MLDICKGCEHKWRTTDRAQQAESYCYMFKEAPTGDFCAQHTMFKAERREAGKRFLEVFTSANKL